MHVATNHRIATDPGKGYVPQHGQEWARGDGGHEPVTMRISLFGDLEVSGPLGRVAGRDFPSRKTKQVLSVLAIAAGHPVSKERLVDQIWADRLPLDPMGTLEQSISVLRRTLSRVDGATVVLTHRGRYLIDASAASTDVADFDRLIDAPRGDDDARFHALQEALALVRGDVLEDEPTATWAEIERNRCRIRIEQANLELATLALARDDAITALAASVRGREMALVAFDEAYHVEIAALARLGRHHEAATRLTELEHLLVHVEQRAPRVDLGVLRALVSAEHRARSSVEGVVTTSITRRAARRQPTPIPLVGRDATLDHAAESIGAGPIMIESAAGMGRSRLLAELEQRCGVERHAIVFGCLPSDHEQPLLAAARLVRVIARRARVRRMPVADDSVASTYGRLAEAIGRLGPTTLLIDDLHLADAATVAVLAALVEEGRVSGLPVQLAVTVRRRGRASLAVLPFEHTITLAALRRDEVGLLDIPDAWSESGGHPASLAACLSAARRDGMLDPTELALVTARVDDAGDLTRLVLRAAALAERPVSLQTLAASTRLALGLVRDLISDSVGDELVRLATDDTVVFAGDVTRRALASSPT